MCFFDWKLSMGALFEGKVDFNSLHLLRIFLLGYTQLQVQKECEKMYNVFLFFVRELVRQIMKTLDPVGVSLRKGNKLKRRQYLSKGLS